MAGWLGVVGKFDVNENPVVILDLDLDFDLGFVKTFFIFVGKELLLSSAVVKRSLLSIEYIISESYLNCQQW